MRRLTVTLLATALTTMMTFPVSAGGSSSGSGALDWRRLLRLIGLGGGAAAVVQHIRAGSTECGKRFLSGVRGFTPFRATRTNVTPRRRSGWPSLPFAGMYRPCSQRQPRRRKSASTRRLRRQPPWVRVVPGARARSSWFGIVPRERLRQWTSARLTGPSTALRRGSIATLLIRC